jgi:hypothetical protein
LNESRKTFKDEELLHHSRTEEPGALLAAIQQMNKSRERIQTVTSEFIENEEYDAKLLKNLFEKNKN